MLLQAMIVEAVELFMLVFVRMTGLFAVSPVFGRKNLPGYYKIGFAFFLALIITGSNNIGVPATNGSMLEFAILLAKEFVIGVSIGFIPYLMFSCIYLAGQLIDMKIGFSMVSVLDPVSNIQIPVTSNFYFMICMVIFVTLNAHHSIIRAIFTSYDIVPVGHIVINEYVIENIVLLFADIFSVGFTIAAPIVFTILLTDVALGVIAKAMPQMNVFIVGMPLKILVGIIIIIVTFPVMFLILKELFGNIELETINYMRGIGAGQS